jgi:hypothetical protein
MQHLEQASLMAYARVAFENRVTKGRPLPFGRSKEKETLVFIDGENLFRFPQDHTSPKKQINWDAFLAALLYKDDQLVRVYWCERQEWGEQSLRMDEVMQLVDLSRKTRHIANETPPRATQAMPGIDVQKKRYTTPTLRRYEQMSSRCPIVDNIKRVHIVRLASGHLHVKDQSISRTLTVAGKLIDVYESQIKAARST